MSPRPGPTFDKDVAAPDIDVIKSKPVKDKSKDNKRNNFGTLSFEKPHV